jgi:hypothetical protein
MEQSIGVHIFEYLTPALQEKPTQNHELTGMDKMVGPTVAAVPMHLHYRTRRKK